MYVTTTEDSVIGAGPHSIAIIEPDRRSLIKKNLDLAARLIDAEFESNVSWEEVIEVSVDSEADLDDSEDYTEEESEVTVIFTR